MKLISEIYNVSEIFTVYDGVVLGASTGTRKESFSVGGDRLLKYRKGKLQSELNHKFLYFMPLSKGLIFNLEESGCIYYYDFLSVKKINGSRFYFNPIQRRSSVTNAVIVDLLEPDNKVYLLDSDLGKSPLNGYPIFLSDEIVVYSDNRGLVVDSLSTISNLWIKPLQGFDLDSRFVFTDTEFLYVNLGDSSLRAFNISDGVIEWKSSEIQSMSSFNIFGGLIYVNCINSIVILSKDKGKEVLRLNYSDYKELEGFYSNGYIWCFDQVLIVRNSFSGELVLFNRGNSKIIDRKLIDDSGIPESVYRIHFVDNYLYVHATSGTVYVYTIDLEV